MGSSRKNLHAVLNKGDQPKSVLVEAATNAGTSEVTVSGPTQSRRKPFHRPRVNPRIAQPAGNNQPGTPAKLGAIDHDGFQIATKRRGQLTNSVPESSGPRGGVPPRIKAKGDSGRHQGKDDRQLHVTHCNSSNRVSMGSGRSADKKAAKP